MAIDMTQYAAAVDKLRQQRDAERGNAATPFSNAPSLVDRADPMVQMQAHAASPFAAAPVVDSADPYAQFATNRGAVSNAFHYATTDDMMAAGKVRAAHDADAQLRKEIAAGLEKEQNAGSMSQADKDRIVGQRYDEEQRKRAIFKNQIGAAKAIEGDPFFGQRLGVDNADQHWTTGKV